MNKVKLPFPWFLKYALLLLAHYTVCLLSGHRWFYGEYKELRSKRVCFRCRKREIANSSPKFRLKVLAMEERALWDLMVTFASKADGGKPFYYTFDSTLREDPEPWPLFKDTKPEDLWLN